MRRRAAGALVAASALLGGCSLGDDEAERTRTIDRTTRVEIFRNRSPPTPRSTFDPQAIYEREAPGVVTVFSVFGGGLFGEGSEQQGVGSGFVVSEDGEIATNAHVVTDGEGGDLRRARSVFVQFADGNQVEARIVGVDPNSDVAMLRIDPAGLTLRPLPLGSSAALRSARRSPRSAPPRRAPVALRGGHLRPRTARSTRSPASRSAGRSRPTRR